MRPLDYLRILRRRWWVLVLGTIVGFSLAYVTRPSELTTLRQTAPKVQYRATHLLVVNPTSVDRSVASAMGYDRLGLFTIAGEVPRNAMEKLDASFFANVLRNDSSGDAEAGDRPDGKARRRAERERDAVIPRFKQGKGSVTIYTPTGIVTVSATPDPATGALAISAVGGKTNAPQVANAFADSLKEFLDGIGTKQWDAQVATITQARDAARERIASIDQQIASAGGNVAVIGTLTGQRAAAQRDVDEAESQLAQLNRAGPKTSQLQTLEPATDKRLTLIISPGGTAVTNDQRMLIGAAVGFILALVLLLVIEILSARIRDVPGTEGAARMPVIAEIPVVKMTKADRFYVATASDPASLTAEAYRSLRTSLLAMWQRHPKNLALAHANGNGHGNGNGHVNGNGNGNGHGGRPLRTLLVTSPGPAEGKSISAVNLAAAFAETGQKVIVLDADFRRPTLHRYFDRNTTPNLGDLDLDCGPRDVEAILQETAVPNVRVAASAPTKSDPGHAMAVAKAAARAAQELADIVILDSPPILLANDAADLSMAVDATVLLARSGWTRRSAVVSAANLLRRLETTVIGVVIVGAEHGARSGYYGYYGYYGYGYGYAHPGEASVAKRLLPWKGGRKASSSSRSPASVATPPSEGIEAPPSSPASKPPESEDPWV